MRPAALIAIPVAAVASVALMLYTGRNSSIFLLTLFTVWVLAPFAALAWAQAVSKRSAALHILTLSLALASVAVYADVALGPPRQKPAFAFLMVPLASCLLIAIVVAITRRSHKS
jgi:hypothetical protein